mmetsp:Transcript_18639/g.74933  ORF Transcript_18639/g.74933 Transcript_18639/m.74933 type:complete len:214 (-) Transcript_18639:1834-2475(-)
MPMTSFIIFLLSLRPRKYRVALATFEITCFRLAEKPCIAQVPYQKRRVFRVLLSVLMALLQQEGLRQKHNRHRYQCGCQEQGLDECLARVHLKLWFKASRRHEHADQYRLNIWRYAVRVGTAFRRIIVDAPLENNEETQVSEDGVHEYHLWHEHVPNIDRLFEESGIPVRKANSQNHLRDSENNRQLHFVRIEEQQPSRGTLPNRIETKRVRS